MVRGDRVDSQVAFFSLDTTYKSTASWSDGTHKEIPWQEHSRFVDSKYANHIHTVELQMCLDKSPALDSTYKAASVSL